MYQMMLNRKTNKKGFTLVEVIVVLVILAILAAIMIPAMTGWIDEANNRKVYVNARTGLLAAQTMASEQYGGIDNGVKITADVALTKASDGFKDLAGTDFVGTFTVKTISDKNQILTAEYTDGTITIEYSSTGGWKEKAASVVPVP